MKYSENCLKHLHFLSWLLIMTWSTPVLINAQVEIDFDHEVIEQEEMDDEPLHKPSTKEVYDFLRQRFPEAYRELMLARDEDAVEDFQAALSRAAEFVAEYREIAREDVTGASYFLEIERSRLKAFTIADQYFAATTELNRSRWLNALRTAAVNLFELQIKEQEHELAELTKEVNAIGTLIQNRKRNRQEEINEILMEFLEMDDDEEDDDDNEDEEDEDE